MTDTGVTIDLARLLIQNASNVQGVKELTEKYSLLVADNTVQLIKQIGTVCPELFTAIKDDVQKIFEDGKLGLDDIPQLVLLCVDIYESKVLTKITGVTGAEIVEAIKVTILLLIDSGVIKLNNEATKQGTVLAINTAAALLARVVGNKPISSCCKCW